MHQPFLKHHCYNRRTTANAALPTDAAVQFAAKAVDTLDATLAAAATSSSSLPPPPHFGSAAASATAARLEAAASSLIPSSSSSGGLVSGATEAVKRAAEALSSAASSSSAALSSSLSSSSSVFATRGGGGGGGASGASPFSLDPHFGSAALDAVLAAPGQALSATSAALASVAEALSGVAAGVNFSPPDFSSFSLDGLEGVGASGVASSLAAASAALAEAASALGSGNSISFDSSSGDFPLPLVLAAALGSVAAAAASAARPGAQAAEANGELSGSFSNAAPTFYTYETASAYWSSRPVAVAKRASALAAAAARVGAGILADKLTGKTKENEALRAAALREELERAGPAFIKIAQAVSTRVDILSPAYVREIERLQDRVPPFSSSLALEEMAKAWGVRDVSEVVSEISTEPVAAASLGQVYKATLSPSLSPRFYSKASSSTEKQALAGKRVAIKVQRPGVGEGILLDLLLLRSAGAALDAYGVLLAERRGRRDGADDGNEEAAAVARARASARRDSGWCALLDQWGARFMEELDYTREAANASYVARQLASLEGVVVPKPVATLSTGTVLVADWIEGERLSESTADDVLTLCTTLLNAYLVSCSFFFFFLLSSLFLHLSRCLSFSLSNMGGINGEKKLKKRRKKRQKTTQKTTGPAPRDRRGLRKAARRRARREPPQDDERASRDPRLGARAGDPTAHVARARRVHRAFEVKSFFVFRPRKEKKTRRTKKKLTFFFSTPLKKKQTLSASATGRASVATSPSSASCPPARPTPSRQGSRLRSARSWSS